jgi:kinesin family protein C1
MPHNTNLCCLSIVPHNCGFQLKITAKHAGRPACESAAAIPPQVLSGVLNMIDLAGSESLTSTDPIRISETQHINRSLGSIADVIGAISSKQVHRVLCVLINCAAIPNDNTFQNHIPFRNSKLTYFLQSSLGGQGPYHSGFLHTHAQSHSNTGKCLMFANVSPGAEQYQETVNTLRFASKVSTCAIGAAQKRAAAE